MRLAFYCLNGFIQNFISILLVEFFIDEHWADLTSGGHRHGFLTAETGILERFRLGFFNGDIGGRGLTAETASRHFFLFLFFQHLGPELLLTLQRTLLDLHLPFHGLVLDLDGLLVDLLLALCVHELDGAAGGHFLRHHLLLGLGTHGLDVGEVVRTVFVDEHGR